MTPASANAWLEVEHGEEPRSRVLLGDAAVRIGRHEDSHVRVAVAHVSKRHAEVQKLGDAFVVVDVGSLAGVLVNGEKIARAELRHGDVIELGDSSPVRITFQSALERSDGTRFATLAEDPQTGGMARLARFFEFGQKLGGGFSLEEVLQDVVDLAIELTQAERGMLILRRDDDTLETRVARASGNRTLPSDGVRVSETLVRQALANGKPDVVEDVADDANLAIAASIVSLELRSAVTLPLLRFESRGTRETGGVHAFGLIYLDSRRRRGSFVGYDLGILERLARDASSVIENARLMREAEERRRIAHEVQMAREVQASLMPEQWRGNATFAIAGTCVPCHDLGGDYVDQFDLGDGRMALVVADVAGKGIAASLLAATLQGALAAEITSGRPLGEAIARVNRVHCRLAPVGKFITMAVALLEADGRVRLVNAGHCPVLHARARGIEAVTLDGIALGLDADFEYHELVLQLAPGDALVLYTDGVIEAVDGAGNLFGEPRLADVLRARPAGGVDATLAHVVRAVEQFRSGAPSNDDLSIVVAQRLPLTARR